MTPPGEASPSSPPASSPGASASISPATWRPSPWPRLILVHALQAVPLTLLLALPGAAGALAAGLLGSVICCLGTDSGWRWLNRMLVLEAAGWLWVAAAAW